MVSVGNLAGRDWLSPDRNCAAGIWTWNAINTLIQRNEVSGYRFGQSETDGCDGTGFDIDNEQAAADGVHLGDPLEADAFQASLLVVDGHDGDAGRDGERLHAGFVFVVADAGVDEGDFHNGLCNGFTDVFNGRLRRNGHLHRTQVRV